jgi:hypothetical protein
VLGTHELPHGVARGILGSGCLQGSWHGVQDGAICSLASGHVSVLANVELGLVVIRTSVALRIDKPGAPS